MEEQWNNAGGCTIKHPWNKERRDECNRLALEKKETKLDLKASKRTADITSAEAERILAEAALIKSGKEDKKWSAGQTLMVVGGALLGLTIMTVVIIKMKKSK